MRIRRAVILVAVGAALSGCANKLETGYEPTKLGATGQQRRAFYAAPFTPEARALSDREDEISARRPRPGY